MNKRYIAFLVGHGRSSRTHYLLWGAIAFAAKYNLDRLVARMFFNEPWHIENYLYRSLGLGVAPASGTDSQFALTMLALAVPFVWIGISLTLRRLRDCGLPLWFVVFFFAPVLNLLFFLLLVVLPGTHEAIQKEALINRPPGLLIRWLPTSKWANAWIAVMISVIVSVGCIFFGTEILKIYGFGLFVGLPFCQALLAVLLYGVHGPQSLRECVRVGLATCVITGGSLLVFAFEGLICLIMAAPIALVLAMFGACVGYLILLCCRPAQELHSSLLTVALFPVLLMVAENRLPEPVPVFAVTSSIDVEAPPETVWQNVVSFAELPPPKELLFRAGIAYPIRAEIKGTGVGAERHCVFSTGSFVEPIEVWEEPILLKFSVTSNPAPMEEWTIYHEVHPPHLDSFLVSQGGQFKLTVLAGNRTRLEGTTWYRHNLWPAEYWRRWSDHIIHSIHLRVLRHIKSQSEVTQAP